MATNGIKVNMTPSPSRGLHPHGGYRGVGSKRHEGGRDSGGSPCDAFRPAERQRRVIARDGIAYREGLRCEHGHAAQDAGLVRCFANAGSRKRDRRPALRARLALDATRDPSFCFLPLLLHSFPAHRPAPAGEAAPQSRNLARTSLPPVIPDPIGDPGSLFCLSLLQL